LLLARQRTEAGGEKVLLVLPRPHLLSVSALDTKKVEKNLGDAAMTTAKFACDIRYEESKIKLTPQKAREFLELDELPGERAKRDYHVDTLAGRMAKGNFRYEHVTLMKAVLGRQTFRINGQHTCDARLEHADDPSYTRTVRLLTYFPENMEELRLLYSDTDGGGSRTPSQRRKALLAGYDGFENTAEAVLNKLGPAYALYKWEAPADRKVLGEPNSLADFMKGDDHGLCVKVAAFATDNVVGKGLAPFRDVPVIAAMFATFSKSAADSVKFWKAVVDGTGIEDASDARKRLERYLTLRGKKAGKKADSSEEVYCRCLQAWNLWRSGQSVKEIKLPRNGVRPSIK